MSTITATVTTTITTIPLLRHRDTVVNFPADQDDFVAKYEATNDHLSVSTVPQINAVGDQIDIITGQINVVAGEVNTNAGIATTQAGIATTQAGIATTQAGIAVAAVASLPVGTLNDSLTTLTNTWSATKINGELATKLNLSGGSLTGELLATAGITVGGDIAFTQIDKGTVSTGTVTFTQSDGNVQRLQVGGALTIATTGWHTTGTYSDLVLQLVNAGSATVTLPTINWIKPDGTTTTTFSVYLTAIARPTLQTSGVDFMYLFTVDGGTTVYGKLI